MFTTQIERNIITGNTLTGGAWHVFSNATLNFINPLIANASAVAINRAVVTLDGPGATLSSLAPLNSNAGTLNLLNGASFTTAGNLTNSGAISLGAGSKLNVSGTYSQTAAGSLMTQISGRPQTNEFGQLSSTGPATLGGALNVQLASGFGPTSGDRYTVMSFPSHSFWLIRDDRRREFWAARRRDQRRGHAYGRRDGARPVRQRSNHRHTNC